MTLRFLHPALAISLVVAAPAVLTGQAASGKPTIAVMKVAGGNTLNDSLAMAITRGLQLDSLLEVVERPTEDGRISLAPGLRVRPATFILTAVTSQVGSTQLVSLRVFNTETSQSVLSASTRAGNAVVGDSLAALGRRVARTLVGAPPVATRP